MLQNTNITIFLGQNNELGNQLDVHVRLEAKGFREFMSTPLPLGDCVFNGGLIRRSYIANNVDEMLESRIFATEICKGRSTREIPPEAPEVLGHTMLGREEAWTNAWSW